MPPTLRRLSPSDLLDAGAGVPWDAYCLRHPKGTPYHLLAWGRAVAEALGHEPCYLCVERGDGLSGVLPLFLRRSKIFGTNLVSVPAANVGGPLADDEGSLRLLLEGALAVAKERDVDFVELRDIAPDSPIAGALQLDAGRYVTVAIDLRPGEAGVWSGLSRGTRRRVRRAEDAGLVAELGDDLDAFYGVYAATMKRLGSPPFSKRLFVELRAGFGAMARFGVARMGAKAAAVDLLLSCNGVRYSVFAGSRSELWELYPNQLLLWAEIRDACASGLRSFDLGRSLARSASLEFKGAWGGREVPLTYGYHLHRARRLPVRTPDMPLYRALGRIWSRLPDPIVTRLGPRLVRHLF